MERTNSLLFLPSPSIKSSVGPHGKDGKSNGKGKQRLLSRDTQSEYTFRSIKSLLHPIVFFCTSQESECFVGRVRPWQHSHWISSPAVAGETALPACTGVWDWSPEHCSFSESIPWPLHFTGPTAWVQRRCFLWVDTAELEPLLVSYKTHNTWMPPSVYMVDVNCNPLQFEFKPKSLHCLVSRQQEALPKGARSSPSARPLKSVAAFEKSHIARIYVTHSSTQQWARSAIYKMYLQAS